VVPASGLPPDELSLLHAMGTANSAHMAAPQEILIVVVRDGILFKGLSSLCFRIEIFDDDWVQIRSRVWGADGTRHTCSRSLRIERDDCAQWRK
jgi:hypothetical protein